jgi:CBS domain-containing protein
MKTLVSELMAVDVLTIAADAPLQQAANEMRLAHINHLPVIDANGAVLGVVTSFDVMRAFAQGNASLSVGEAMSTPPVVARDSDSAVDAAHRLHSRRVGCLPVIDGDGKLVGLVTESDFVGFVEQALR